MVFRQQGPLWFVAISQVGDVVDYVIKLLDMVHAQIVRFLYF